MTQDPHQQPSLPPPLPSEFSAQAAIAPDPSTPTPFLFGDRQLSQRVEAAALKLQKLRESIGLGLVGQRDIVDQIICALLASGHVLIEGVPGLGKTLLVRALAKSIQGAHARIQFTPDLMPSDVIGHLMYDMQKSQFNIRRGPVFTNILLADEINRAPAKTQSALLEAMQERQVTIEGRAMLLPDPFLTLATQNPIEQEGTYPLPEAQLDRFLLKIQILYPDEAEECEMIQRIAIGKIADNFDLSHVQAVLNLEEIKQLQQLAADLAIDQQVAHYAVRLVRATRSWPGVHLGAGPRGSIALLRVARAHALMSGREFVTPDDLKRLAPPALRHRLALSPDAEIEGRTSDQLLREIIQTVEAPRV